ncbi:MCP methyltransferase, CheR-type [Desulfovibrio sp. X2]|uniref:CheR family methyltransferase n=1 Tax=Desulfovibrio sp. X2 TaxID=941449 RepID=UPI000358D955|nr:protein-glutamate O-methyltransferase CheR [Desulfovibrio sp. X2]EPR43970.1 MCP methyltransferase, CheR-type [Desulfovibrio sp. X2]
MLAHQIDDIEIDLLLEGIYRRYGYDFRHYSKASAKRRVLQFMQRTDHETVGAMIPRLLRDEEFFSQAVEAFSVTVTEMFRDPGFFAALREEVVPRLRTFPFIKIWHAGCATGEEVYSLAILLKEEGLYDRATIFATDLSRAALDKAREGIYSMDEMRVSTANYQKAGGSRPFTDYYHAEYDSAIIDGSLKRNITFAHHNLATDSAFGEMHLIVCRNVLIYFDQSLQNRVLNLFMDSLALGGLLCLGSKESCKGSDAEASLQAVNPKWRIFRRHFVAGATPRPGVLGGMPPGGGRP